MTGVYVEGSTAGLVTGAAIYPIVLIKLPLASCSTGVKDCRRDLYRPE
jgi:hypothetical protein